MYIYSNILNNQKMIQGLQITVLQEILLFKRWGCGVLSCCGGVPFCSPRKEPMAQATLSCPFGAIHLENHRGTHPGRLYRNAGAGRDRIIFLSAPLPLI